MATSEPEGRFAVRRQVHEDRVVVWLQGEIDLMVADRLLSELHAAVEQSPEIEVDLAEVTFLDSTGIRALLNAHAAALRLGHRIYVTNASGIVMQVLEVTGVDSLLTADPRDRRPQGR
ncbi:hypothetical protein Cme02nite_01240 [Catellatospora methionotrophica]|uniref:Anti-sigma factor antagonist n=1 Tax=Catellatospora methionotrophica TaxID=121620 RepID=A0A8J3PCA1_9ACTN|nr:STAS domain-containing protein [Catellatospora methionotrophica]GIG11792.1 hypothetical protein Cme02nite_01240 [Catellatospora methionotrophica]